MLARILNSHHAILLEGNPSEILNIVKSEFALQGISVINNPDFIFIFFEKFGIAESRQIIEMSNGAPVKESKKRIIFGFNTITIEAENALLKIMEDPSPQIGFIIATYSANGLLPTLRSRIQIVNIQNNKIFLNKTIEEFMDMNIGERMQEVEKIIKEYRDKNDKQLIKDFLLSLHYFFENKIKKGNGVRDMISLDRSTKALSYLEDKSSSVKILLESVVLAL